jgi:hypothetical protein
MAIDFFRDGIVNATVACFLKGENLIVAGHPHVELFSLFLVCPDTFGYADIIDRCELWMCQSVQPVSVIDF